MGLFKSFGKKTEKQIIPEYYDIICPFCFEKYKPDEVVFRAMQSREDDEEYQLQEDELLNKYRRRFKMGDASDMEAIIYPENIPMERKKIVDGVLVEIIDKYNVKTSKRLCPRCHNELPITAGKIPGNIISIVGASQVGKSVYMTILIHTLENFTANLFDASCMPVSVESSKKFRELYESPIYDSGVLPGATQKEARPEPLMFQFRFKDSRPPLTLVFFDVAGEGMTDKEYMEVFAAHIKNSTGMLFLVDPLQIRAIRNKIDIKKDDHTGDFTAQYDEPREVIISMFENFIGHQQKGKTDIPTAVVLTKSDMLKVLSGEDYIRENSNMFQNVVHKKYLNKLEFENINGEVRRFLEKVDRAFCDAVDVYFEKTAYFAISALGNNPVNRKIVGTVSPVRVDEPFLWILQQLGYIEGR